ncbi:dihydrolipoyl dehydrogenase family protein [Jannaschia sp. LMIT008]|uniref:dihydrolipoyl dehydrogenase family protein n=1 Tax=Jannaschia maritima TaxID=3032585 RepID=UPI0028128D7D|nr:FAD-dependent oxidoreductase [Jannaschia sp. LMIT008]
MNAIDTTKDIFTKDRTARPTDTPQDIKTDVLVIGAGSGGLSVAYGASQMGADVTLLEGHRMGGDCLNFGCVPSKALIAAAKHAHAMTTGAPFGVTPVDPKIDYAEAKRHVHGAIATIAPVDSQERFEGLGVRVIREYGRFVDDRTVEAGPYRIRARRIVIATGSSPFVPPIPGLADVPYYTNETIFDLMEAPDHLIVVGGGPIGLEMAQAHRRLGIPVTVVEGGAPLAKDDPELAAIVLARLKEEGVEILSGARAERVSQGEDGITVHTASGAVTGSHLLMAVGRKANVESLNLDAAGIDYDRAVTVGADLRTTNRRVYAIGDAAGGFQFTHVAGYHGATIIRPILFGLPARARTDHIPWATYTDPELAQVGLTEAQAREKHGDAVEVLRFPYHENDRAIAEGKTEGLIKVMIVKGRPVGASIAGAQAGELIGLWALVLANKLKIGAVAAMVAPYPTLGEISKRAAGQYYAPRLFENDTVKRVVRAVQRWLP